MADTRERDLDARTAIRMSKRFEVLVTSIVAEPDTLISDLQLDDPVEVPIVSPIIPVG